MQESLKNNSLQKTRSIAVALVATVMLVFVLGCAKEQKSVEPVPLSQIPTLKTLNAVSLISDSGITRYRFEAKEWLMFSKGDKPYWYFPQGIYVEKFDTLFQPEAFIQADTAYFFEREKIWKLIGNVHMKNMQDETFETQLLFWDQNLRRIYSDSTIRIEQPERVIVGKGFESNEAMDKYTLRDTEGVFLIKEEDNDSIQNRK